jgi:hypothetical protein
MTILEFLTARYDDEEVAARLADGEVWKPAHVLADITAKRRIVEKCNDTIQGEPDMAGYDGESPVVLSEDILCDLATVYADHPDFREEWRSGWWDEVVWTCPVPDCGKVLNRWLGRHQAEGFIERVAVGHMKYHPDWREEWKP